MDLVSVLPYPIARGICRYSYLGFGLALGYVAYESTRTSSVPSIAFDDAENDCIFLGVFLPLHVVVACPGICDHSLPVHADNRTFFTGGDVGTVLFLQLLEVVACTVLYRFDN